MLDTVCGRGDAWVGVFMMSGGVCGVRGDDWEDEEGDDERW